VAAVLSRSQGPFLAAPARDIALVALAYAVSLAAGWGAYVLTPGSLVLRFFVADTVATIALFGGSRIADNTSLYDPYWSLVPVPLGVGAVLATPGGDPIRIAVVLGVVSIWCVRLTLNWLRGWPGLHHEDWRYQDYRVTWGRFYWLGSFFGLHYFPTVITFLGSLSLLAGLPSQRPFGALDALGAAVALGGTVLEHVADEQLRTFRRDPKNKGAICAVGVWGRSRHPNYLGEILFWIGLWIASIGAAPEAWWTASGPLSIVLLMRLASIPLADNRSLKNRPAYAAHMKQVPALVPFPGKRARPG